MYRKLFFVGLELDFALDFVLDFADLLALLALPASIDEHTRNKSNKLKLNFISFYDGSSTNGYDQTRYGDPADRREKVNGFRKEQNR
jgi:hypothetical protein